MRDIQANYANTGGHRYCGHATDIIGYVHEDGFALCAEHGAPMDTEDDTSPVGPIFADMSSEWADLYCDECQARVCGQCGTVDDESTRAPWRECWNCHATVVYIDGHGYVWADDDELARVSVPYTWDSRQEYRLTYTVEAHQPTPLMNLRTLTVDHVDIWARDGRWFLYTYGLFGNAILIIAGNRTDADDVAEEWLRERIEHEHDARDETYEESADGFWADSELRGPYCVRDARALTYGDTTIVKGQ